MSDKVWKQVVQEVDADGNGEIDYQEFEKMMVQMLKH